MAVPDRQDQRSREQRRRLAVDDPLHCPAPRQHLDRASELAAGPSATYEGASGHLVHARYDWRHVVSRIALEIAATRLRWLCGMDQLAGRKRCLRVPPLGRQE